MHLQRILRVMLRRIWLQMEAFESENALLDAFVEAVRALDPDILVGFEVQQGSLGFLVDRASTLERPDPLLRQLSRTPQVIVHAVSDAPSQQQVAFPVAGCIQALKGQAQE